MELFVRVINIRKFHFSRYLCEPLQPMNLKNPGPSVVFIYAVTS